MSESFYGLDWLEEFLTADLEEAAAIIRQQADSHARFLEGKAQLLREQLRIAQGIEAGTGETDFCAESAHKSGSTATPRKPGPKDALVTPSSGCVWFDLGRPCLKDGCPVCGSIQETTDDTP